MKKRKKSSIISAEDSSEKTIEKNEKLIQMIRNRDKKIRILQSENKTLKSAWEKTEFFLSEVTDGVSLEEIISNVISGKPLKKTKGRCPVCDVKNMKKLDFGTYYIIICDSCLYRNRVDERTSI